MFARSGLRLGFVVYTQGGEDPPSKAQEKGEKEEIKPYNHDTAELAVGHLVEQNCSQRRG